MAQMWHTNALNLAESLRQLDPMSVEEFTIAFALASVRRRMGESAAAKRFYAKAAARDRGGAWGRVARAESILIRGGVPGGDAIWYCAPAREAPRIDGRLRDSAWRSGLCSPHDLTEAARTTATEAQATSARITYDTERLYISVVCPGPPPDAPATAPDGRPVTGLADVDHVEVILDIDRDFASTYRFAVDARGRRTDSCLDCEPWHGPWTAQTAAREDGWSVEIALPFETLGSWDRGHPKAGDTWRLNVVRHRPGLPVLAWGHPAGRRPRPEGMGLLRFGRPARRTPYGPNAIFRTRSRSRGERTPKR